jgi:hypothetical protein
VTASIPVGETPDGVAVDPAAGVVYVTNAGDNTVSVISAARPVSGPIVSGYRATSCVADSGDAAANDTPITIATCDGSPGQHWTVTGSGTLQFGDRGLTQIMNNSALGDARVSEARDRIAPLMTTLVERAKQQGVIRPDFNQTDLVFFQVALTAVIESSRAVSPELYHRYLTMLLDGIRTDREAFTPLPTAALTANQTHIAMTHQRRAGKQSQITSNRRST